MRIGYYTTPEGQARYFSAYERAMAQLPEPSGTHDVETEFGRVRLYRFGNSAGTPLVLLPGRSGTSAMWAPNIAALSRRRRVFCLDTLGEPGRSIQTSPIRDARDQANWLGTALTAVVGDEAHLVGMSFGGWLAFNQAMRRPERIASVSLLDPAGIFARFRLAMMLGAGVAMVPFAPPRLRQRFLEWISGEAPVPEDDPTADVIAGGMAEYKPALPGPAYPGDDELRSMRVPILAVIAGRSAVHDPASALQRARTLLPDAETELWSRASHAISGEFAEEVNSRLLEFVARIEGRPVRW